MLQIQNTLVSLDLIDTFFCCDLDECKGMCCVEGDAGAPLLPEEDEEIKEVLPIIKKHLQPEALDVIENSGTSYIDEEGDLVTSIIDGKDCVFSCYSHDGVCLCAIEKCQRAREIKVSKPVSCHLYPVRLTEYPTFTAVNYHKWNVCRPALAKGEKLGLRLYEFLKEPLIRRFGQDWWEELDMTAKIYLENYKNL